MVKLEGNPDHPVNRGALCIRGQAALQGLYHPDRFAGPRRRDGNALAPVEWDDAMKLLAEKLGRAARSRTRAGPSRSSPSSRRGASGVLLDEWAQALGRAAAREPASRSRYEAIRAANRATFGRDAMPYYAFEDAEVVLSFGADFLETWLGPTWGTRVASPACTPSARARRGTFIHVEPRQSLTAANADEWVRNAPGHRRRRSRSPCSRSWSTEAWRRSGASATRWPASTSARRPRRAACREATLKHIAENFGARASPGWPWAAASA